MSRFASLLALSILIGLAPARAEEPRGDYLFIWAADAQSKASDFLAVIDADPTSESYAEIVATAPTGVRSSGAHHTEHVMSSRGILFANGFEAGRTFIYDLNEPLRPKVIGSFGNAGEFMHPHSFARTPKNTVLATYQMRGHRNAEAGALVELDASGKVLRLSPAADPKADSFIRPYSLVVVPAIDRVVTTNADMHETAVSHSVQVWRLSDLRLLATVKLPQGSRGNEGNDPAEPRLLADGRTVVVSTFNCGLYLLSDLAADTVQAHHVGTVAEEGVCALPVVAGNYWIATNTHVPGLVSFDISNPWKPVEVSRLKLSKGQAPHWIALAPDGERIAISGGHGALESRVLMARVSRSTGKLMLEESFRDKGSREPGVSFNREHWLHGPAGRALPHGAVFSRPRF